MSMLAERKVKQKWSLNPRGKNWTDDQNKFGQKMLEKMGWSNGKGLGAKLDGITEHVKVNYKNDSKGMGFKERDDQWTEHEDQFSTLLSSLSAAQDEVVKLEKPAVSLVEKSKNSRARIHYKKFTKGKDISQYSEKDLANVFGRKELHKKKTEVAEESTTPETEDSEEHTHGVKTIKGGSMADYFKKKLAGKSMESNGVMKKDSDSEDERPSFGFGFSQKVEGEERAGFGFSGFQLATPQKDTPIMNGDDESLSSSKKKKKKNKENQSVEVESLKKKKSSELEEEVVMNGDSTKKKKKHKKLEYEDNIDVENNTPIKACKKIEDSIPKTPTFVSYISEESSGTGGKKRKLEEAEENSPKKKKKKKKDVGLCNPGFDPIFHPPPMEKHHLNTITEADEEIVDDSKNTNAEELNSNVTIEELNVSHSKKKKKKKRQDVTEELDSSLNDVNGKKETQIVTEDLDSSKKKGEQVVTEDLDCSLNDVSSKKNKKKKKKDKVLADVVVDNNAEEVVTKKKKRKFSEVDGGVENACFNGVDDGQVEEAVVENPYEVKAKKKKKKKSKDKDDLDQAATPKKQKLDEPSGIDNPALNITSIEDITFDMILNTTIETPKPKTQGRKSVTFSEVNQEHIIPNREELAAQQTELFDINTMILEESTKRRQKNHPNGYFDNRAFNMRSTGSEVYDKRLETQAPKVLNGGKVNPRFFATQDEKIRNELDTYQSQVENDLNEAKAMVVGTPGKGLEEAKVVEDGIILPFKKATFSGVTYSYYKVNMTAKGSYKHLIRGDIMLYFKNSNLHRINGYGTFKRNIKNK